MALAGTPQEGCAPSWKLDRNTAPQHTHTHHQGEKGSESGCCSQGRLKMACCTACRAHGLDLSRRLSAEGRGAFPPRRTAEWRGRVVGTARQGRPAGTVSERPGLPPRSFLSWMEGQDYYVKQALLLFGCWAPQAACQGMTFRSGHWVLRKSVSTAESQPRELCLSGRAQSGAACLYGEEALLECK